MTPKMALASARTFPHHRSGWGYALHAIKPLLTPGGVWLDPFIEETFNWNLAENVAQGILPYQDSWVGIVHNPPGIPRWHEFDSAPENILALPVWQKSIGHCRGLFTFSETMRDWLAARVAVPVEALIHPTEAAEQVFQMEAFMASPERRIIQVGSWMRRLNSIALLPVTNLRRTCLLLKPDVQSLVQRERENEDWARAANWSGVELIPYLDAAAFDTLLARNIVFLDLYDTVVNNTVLECIVRGTPLVCNRLPALVELLGEEYPLFFTSSLQEAAAKAEDLDLIARAHEHLMRIPKKMFTGEAFAESIANSSIYRALPVVG